MPWYIQMTRAAKHKKITITLRYVNFVPAKPDIHVSTKQENTLSSFVDTLIRNGQSEAGWHYRLNNKILAQKGANGKKSLLTDHGIVNASVIEVYGTANPNYNRAKTTRREIEGEDQLTTPGGQYFKSKDSFSNYLVAPFSLDFSTKMTSVQRLKQVQYSGITETKNPFNRVKANSRKFDLTKYGGIVLFHWGLNSARKLESACLGFEFLVNEMDGQLGRRQAAGIASKSMNLMAYSLAKKIPGIRKLLKEMIIQALEFPVFLHSDDDIAGDEALAQANEIIMLQAQENVESLIKAVYASSEAEAFKLHVEKSLQAWTYLTEDRSELIEADIVSEAPLSTTPDVQNDVKPSSSKSDVSRKRTRKSATPNISEPPIKKFLIPEPLSEKKVELLNKQGMNKYENDEYEDALTIFFQLIGIEETGRNDSYWLGKLWNNVSICWSGLERHKKALEASEKAIEYDEPRSVHFYNRAIAYRDLGRRTEAKADFKRVIKLDPTDDGAKVELAKLKKRETR